ncbi:unnamed protein product [Ceratitis capitata]|uniref:(Mediterranean fruit fly) hypothetical protein n=1 Tax=Ceratitis capitata TaxID=7213 RepID=A0A811VBK7_CERCA|nr:unnamed protein product [Ceratitis capitata]
MQLYSKVGWKPRCLTCNCNCIGGMQCLLVSRAYIQTYICMYMQTCINPYPCSVYLFCVTHLLCTLIQAAAFKLSPRFFFIYFVATALCHFAALHCVVRRFPFGFCGQFTCCVQLCVQVYVCVCVCGGALAFLLFSHLLTPLLFTL